MSGHGLRALSAGALIALCHCDVAHTNADAASDATIDRAEVGAIDASAETAAPHPACDSVIDLSTAEPVDAGAAGVRVMGDNGDAPEGLANALQPSSGRCEFRAVRQRLYRYRLRSDAALRVSTNNPGSDPGFDSTIFVTTSPCSRAATVLACNDDDPFAIRPPHVTLSQATTGGLAAGTEVIISVAGFYPADGSGQQPNPQGETGTYELTVIEVPSRREGERCDTSGRSDACVSGAHCVADDLGVGSCVRDGSRPGAQCDDGGQCAATLECDVQRFTCFGTSATPGAVCELGESANRCARGLSCVTRLRGQRRGACALNGTEGAACAASEAGVSTCDAGLVCARGVCKRPVAMAAACDLLTDACTTGASCVASTVRGGTGTCVPDGSAHGAACRSGASECDAGLFCIIDTNRERACRTIGTASGARCDDQGACSFDWLCMVDEPSRPFEAYCRLPGETGTECQSDAGCSGGRRCVGRTSTAAGRCLAVVTIGGACDPDRRLDACETGASCVGLAADARCVANGTAAGSTCRAGATPCDAPLSCATDLGNRCVASAAIDAPCAPRFNTVRCASGAACAARGLDAGSCAVPTMEVEPNDRASAAMGAPSVFVRGALGRFDIDCYAIDVPAGGGVYAHAVNANGQCTGNTVLDLYDPAGRWLGSDADAGPSGCPRVDGALYSWARGLAQGVYSVCLREANNGIVSAYALSATRQEP
jgi:hypothetical protein